MIGFIYNVGIGLKLDYRYIHRELTVESNYYLDEYEIEKIAMSRVDIAIRYLCRVEYIEVIKEKHR